MSNFDDILSPLRWTGSALELLDQRLLPVEERWVECRDHAAVARAIKDMVVRGAPAIGCAAAYGVALGARAGVPLERVIADLRATRPTAVNLFWALDRMARVAPPTADALAAEAVRIHEEDIASCMAIGKFGAPLLPDGVVLTHCNAGALATGGYGTALGVVRAAHAAGRRLRVFADETRPFLQGARLTAWELQKSGIDVTVITDNMAAHLMAKGEIQSVIVGADRIAANGDTANKIGTYGVALLAREHGLPFVVAAPRSTVDLAIPDGAHIPIEERDAREVTHMGDRALTPGGVAVRNPAFDVTPARLIAAIVTERGVARPPYNDSLASLFDERAT
ncbi:MAG TPA: S-methyl-5-thioribose-1-phosphate isomerase [Polyangia bacterium]|nr:S-methyl-5-thioribose-1-phosphate isomerase [Polyangia bacterium]